MNQIEQYQLQLPHYREALELLAAIREQRGRLETVPDADDVFPELSTEVAGLRLQQGQALINLNQDDCDLSQPRAYFLSLLTLPQLPAEASRQILTKIKERPETYAENLKTVLATRQPYLIENELDLGSWLMAESGKPFLGSLRNRFTDQLDNHSPLEENHHCPVCNAPSRISLLQQEVGFRRLYCLACEYQWPVSRRRCPFCGNQEADKLAYFTLDDHDGYRVDVCHQCQGYLKTFDYRKMAPDPDLELENLITLHLDLRAISEGFH